MWCGCRWRRTVFQSGPPSPRRDHQSRGAVALSEFFTPGHHEAFEVGGAQRFGEGVALQRVGAERRDDAGVLLALDALGDDADAEGMPDIDDGAQQLALA